MINELARMRFQSGRNANESGALVLTDDGFLQIEPSAAFSDQLAALEDRAVERSRKIGITAMVAFFALGAATMIVAWLMGRIGGEMRQTISEPHPIDDVAVDVSDNGGIRVIIPGAGPQKITMEWERGEFNDDEATQLVRVYRRFREIG